MKIWIDISNAPHVNFFRQFIEEWKTDYEIVVTARPLSNTIDLLEKHKINFNSVGAHYGKKKISKLLGFLRRSSELYAFLKKKNIDIAISQSSFYSPYVAKKLKIPCIYTNDNEYAKGNYIGFLLAETVLLPESMKKWVKNRFFKKRVVYYPGVKEGIYIREIKKASSKNGNTIYFRPEPWHAQYHAYSANMFDDMLRKLAKKFKIVILPRDMEQEKHYSNMSDELDNIAIPSGVEPVEKIAEKCDFFLGAGGSMTREFALMGIPTVSIYQGSLLEVDNYLIECGLLISEPNPQKITPELIDRMQKDKAKFHKICNQIQEKGGKARDLIRNLIKERAA
jgi:hypothetical protein